MALEVMYQSPKKDHPTNQPHRSSWISEHDTVARQRLEERGWKIISTREAPAEAAPAPLQSVPRNLPGAPTGEAQTFDATRVEGLTRFDFLTDDQRSALAEAGYGDDEALRAASDEDLRAVRGIGAAAVRNLRKSLLTPNGEDAAG